MRNVATLQVWLLGLLGIVIATGCNAPNNSARGVVDRFIEARYMAIDDRIAERYCTGLALEKLKTEESLTSGQTIGEDTRKPTIHYKLKEQRDTPDRVIYLFLATIEVPDGGSFDKKWMITARKQGQSWKVSNYNEYD